MRTRLKVPRIKKDVTPAWLVQQQEKKKSGWEILTDKKGKVIHHQLVPPSLENDRFFNESSRSSWVLEIIESCYVSGVAAEVGDMVANTTGVVLGFSIALSGAKNILLKIEKIWF